MRSARSREPQTGKVSVVSEHLHEDELEERNDVVDDDEEPDPGEPWAKASTGDAENVTKDD